MTLGFNENGTVSSYAQGVEPPGGRAVVVRQDDVDMLKDYIQNGPGVEALLPLDDRVLIVRGLVEKADAERRMAKRRTYAGPSQAAVAQRQALRYSADECERVAKLLCEAWGLKWWPYNIEEER